MKLHRPAGLAGSLAVALLAAAPALAAPVTVHLRIEGARSTYYDAPVTTDVRTVDGHDGTGPHTCDGTSGGGQPGPTVGAALATASERAPFSFHAGWNAGLSDFLLDTVQGETPDFSTTQTFWGLYLDGAASMTGMCGARLSPGEDVLFAVGKGTEQILHLSGPASGTAGQAIALRVTDEAKGTPVAGAAVGGAVTGADGTARVIPRSAGRVAFKASKAGAIRSNAIAVTVTAAGAPAPAPAPAAPDRTPPGLRIRGIREQQVFRHGKGPRVLRATVPADPAGLAAVKLRLTRQVGRRCWYYSARVERFRRTRCGHRVFFAIGDDPRVSYLLPERLKRGRYVLDLVAVDGLGNRDPLARGTTRVVFHVR